MFQIEQIVQSGALDAGIRQYVQNRRVCILRKCSMEIHTIHTGTRLPKIRRDIVGEKKIQTIYSDMFDLVKTRKRFN